MTDDRFALHALLEKGLVMTFLREMIRFAVQRPMELETDALCGAGHGERSESRVNNAIATGRPGPARLSYGSRSYVTAAITRGSWSRAVPRRRR